MAIEIVDFPIENGDFPQFFVNVYHMMGIISPWRPGKSPIDDLPS